MATSGTTTFELDVADMIEEAYERLQLEVRSGYDAKTARRSLNLLLQHLSNKQVHLWTLTLTTQVLVQGTASYVLDAGIIDISNAVLNRDSKDIQMSRLSRQEYQNRPNKTTQARPSQYWLDRKTTPVLYLYPAPQNATDTVKYFAMTRIQDVNNSINTLQIPSRFMQAVISGLTYYLSLKKKPELAQIMKTLFDEELREALDEDRERVSFRIVPKVARL
jgi:hypothetical protein